MFRKTIRTTFSLVILLTVVSVLFRLSGIPGIPFPRTLSFMGDPEEFIPCFVANAGFGAVDPFPSYRVRKSEGTDRILIEELMGFVRAISWRGVFVDPTENGFIVSDMYFENTTQELNMVRKFEWLVIISCGLRS